MWLLGVSIILVLLIVIVYVSLQKKRPPVDGPPIDGPPSPIDGPSGFVGKGPLPGETGDTVKDGSSVLFRTGTCCAPGGSKTTTDYISCGKVTGSEFFPYAKPKDIVCDPAQRPSPPEQPGVCSPARRAASATPGEPLPVKARGDCVSSGGVFMGYGTRPPAIEAAFGAGGPRWGDRRYMVEFIVVNRSAEPVYLGLTPGRGPDPGGFRLAPGAGRRVWMPKGVSFRLWARTGCGKFRDAPAAPGGGFGCETGDCSSLLNCGPVGGTPPVTIAEFTTGGAGGQTFYDVSVVDGFNFPVQIVPVQKTTGPAPPNQAPGSARYYCGTAGCVADLNRTCPAPLQVKNANSKVVACKSACAAFDTDQYCCRGRYGQPSTCNPTEWPTNYNRAFKAACPDAYSYAYDDSTSTFTCRGTNGLSESYYVYLG